MGWAVAAVLVIGAMAADRLGVFGLAPPDDLARYDQQTFRVVHVVDGDTLDVGIPDGTRSTTRVRLWGVDTPELARNDRPADPFGPEARRFTRKLADGQPVTLRLEARRTRGRYGRLLAYVLLPDGRMLNRLLVEQGYAYADPRFEHSLKRQFASLQKRAIRRRVGLWAEITRRELPSYYRQSLRLPAESPTTTSAPAR
jgi:endonuclease YncB( thermonuclease family)